jgi:tetratricopeptide (TPR) repeat protein
MQGLSRITDVLGVVRKLVASLGLIAIVLILVGELTVSTLSRSTILEPFDVPKSLSDSGYSSSVVSAMLRDRIQAIYKSASDALYYDNNGEPLSASAISKPLTPPELEIPGAKVSFSSAVSFIRDTVGFTDKHISGSITMKDEKEYRLVIRISGDVDDALTSEGESIEEMLTIVAPKLLQRLDPGILALHLYKWEGSQDAPDYHETLDAAEKLLVRHKDNDEFWGWLLTANVSRKRGDWEESIRRYDLALKAAGNAPRSAKSWAYVQWAHAYEGPDDTPCDAADANYSSGYRPDYAKAKKMYEKAIEVNEQDAIAYDSLAILLEQRLGNTSEAAKVREKALKVFPRQPVLLTNMCNTLTALDRYVDAIARCRAALDYDPLYAEAYFNWANALENWARSEATPDAKYREAIPRYRKALELNANRQRPDSRFFEANLRIGKLSRTVGAHEDAVAAFTLTTMQGRAGSSLVAQAYYWWAVTIDEYNDKKADEIYGKARTSFEGVCQGEISKQVYDLWGKTLDKLGADKSKDTAYTKVGLTITK